MGDPANLTASEAAAALHAGTLSAEDLTRACLARIEKRDPEVQAWVWLDADHALAQARARDAERRAGDKPLGPLHGLPVGIKDIIDVADMPTQNGSPIFVGHRPERDSGCVATLRNAGAVILGKTVTTELATLTPNKTRNPHNPGHTPGGSSSGSAAGVACGMMPLAIGTQTGGSVIRPGSFCGVFALKPTLGFISRTGTTLQSQTLDTLGVYGRSVADLALGADALCVQDPTDPASYPRSGGGLRAALSEPLPKTQRLAFCRTPAWDAAEPVTKDLFEDLAKRLGDVCTSVDLPPAFADIVDLHRCVQGAENARHYGPLLDRRPDGISPGLAERIRAGNKITARDYIAAIDKRDPLHAALADLLADYDAILTPSSTGPAPKGLESTGDPIFNGLWTYLGVPCVSLPLLTADGLPLGVQLVGPRRSEGRLLRTAQWLVERLA